MRALRKARPAGLAQSRDGFIRDSLTYRGPTAGLVLPVSAVTKELDEEQKRIPLKPLNERLRAQKPSPERLARNYRKHLLAKQYHHKNYH